MKPPERFDVACVVAVVIYAVGCAMVLLAP